MQNTKKLRITLKLKNYPMVKIYSFKVKIELNFIQEKIYIHLSSEKVSKFCKVNASCIVYFYF